jgi:hypothetical protein
MTDPPEIIKYFQSGSGDSLSSFVSATLGERLFCT